MDDTPNELRRDISEALRDTALLADVTIATWGAQRTDHKIMEDAKQAAGAKGNVGRAIKNMLAGADLDYKATIAAFSAVRAEHYAMTLPFVSDAHAQRQVGARLLPVILFDKYLDKMRVAKKAATEALDKFIDTYPAAIEKAKENLAGLADADYPSPEAIRPLFRVEFDFKPIPAGADFRGIPDQLLVRVTEGLRRKQETALAGARAAMWTDVRDRVGSLVSRLADPETKFRATTVENVAELADLLPGWGLGDPRAIEIAADIANVFGDEKLVKQLRDNIGVREATTRAAQAVMDKLSSWGL